MSITAENRACGHEKFHYSTLAELRDRAEQLQAYIPLSDDTSVLREHVPFGAAVLQNRLGIAPLEAADSLPNGAPSERTVQRYRRYAEGGAGLIWIEATAIAPEARNGVRQLMLTADTLDDFKTFAASVHEAGLAKNGYAPYLVLQAHHSGRYSSPGGVSKPLAAYRHPVLDQGLPMNDDCVVSDAYLRQVEEEFGVFAGLAKEAGFDAVDVKCCHGYLLPELTSAWTRQGAYGGCFENRVRLLCNAVAASRVHDTPTFQTTARIGVYDGLPWPYGFGVQEHGDAAPDMTESIRLVRLLHEKYGLDAVNLTVGNPCVYKHINRPFDHGPYVPDEHPLRSMARIIGCIGEIKKAVPDMTISASAASYMRQYAGNYVAGAVSEGYCDHMLFGRMALANPDFPKQLFTDGRIDGTKTCVTCSGCENLLCSGKATACVLHRDRSLP